MTGGLPFFGGAGNNYAMHAISSMVRALRARPQDLGFVGANGGYLSKYSVGIYSARPRPWTGFDSQTLQAEIDAWPAPALAADDVTSGTVDTYTIDYSRDVPAATLIGRTATGARFVAMTQEAEIVQQLIDEEPLGGVIETQFDERRRRIVRQFKPRAAGR
jgi:acetyl-CoA C-acetyltransferase